MSREILLNSIFIFIQVNIIKKTKRGKGKSGKVLQAKETIYTRRALFGEL